MVYCLFNFFLIEIAKIDGLFVMCKYVCMCVCMMYVGFALRGRMVMWYLCGVGLWYVVLWIFLW